MELKKYQDKFNIAIQGVKAISDVDPNNKIAKSTLEELEKYTRARKQGTSDNS